MRLWFQACPRTLCRYRKHRPKRHVAFIRSLNAIEADIRGGEPATHHRAAGSLRLDPCPHQCLIKPPPCPRVHQVTIRRSAAFTAKYRDGLGNFLANGRVELNSNTVERMVRPIALTRKNALFAGHDTSAETWGVIASLIETCNGAFSAERDSGCPFEKNAGSCRGPR